MRQQVFRIDAVCRCGVDEGLAIPREVALAVVVRNECVELRGAAVMRGAVQHGKLVELAVSLRVLAGVEQRGVFLDGMRPILRMLLLRHCQQRERVSGVGDTIVLSSTRHTAVVIRRILDAVKRRLAAQYIALT